MEDRGPPCTLLVFIDDATSRLQQLLFVASESAFSYFDALEQYLTRHGRPVAFYSDKRSVFRVAKKDPEGGQGMTQFGRALSELSILMLSPIRAKAKGRVDGPLASLQDRLVTELRLAGISDMAAGNRFLDGFTERYNARFATSPARADDLHRPLNIDVHRLRDVLCKREQRYVGRQLAFSYERQRVILEANGVSRGLISRSVDVYAFADGRFDVRWKGMTLPHTIFDKEQRVTHAAITESKRLSDVLAFIKERQDQLPPPRVKTNSEVIGYQKRRQEPPGRKGWVDQIVEPTSR